jgi:hypothetical protein
VRKQLTENKETTLLLRDHRPEIKDKEWGGGCGIEENKLLRERESEGEEEREREQL